MPDLIRR